MSFLSTLGSIVGGVASAAGNVMSAVPGLNILGSAISQGGSFLQGQSAAYEQNKQNQANRQLSWDLQKDAQKFNSNESYLSFLRNQQAQQQAMNFNSIEAEKQRIYEKEMWQKSNDYNSPANQLRLLQEAGYNPNLFNDSTAASVNAGAGASASSSPLSAPSASSPMASSPIMPNPAMVASQIRLANAQASKAESEVKLSNVQSERVKELLKGELSLQNVQISLGNADEQLKRVDAIKALKECEKLDSDIQLASSSIAKLQSEVNLNLQELKNKGLQGEKLQIELDNYEKRLQAELYEILSSTAKNYASVRLSDAEVRHIASQLTLEGIQSGILALDFSFKQGTQDSQIKATISSNEQEISDIQFDTNLYDGNKSLWQNAVGLGRWFTRGVGRMMSGNVSLHKKIN